MFLQTDRHFSEAINRFGCYFLSILCQAEIRRNRAFTKDDIISIFISAKNTGIVSKERYSETNPTVLVDGCFVSDPVSIFTLAGIRIQSIKKEDANYVAKENEIEILQYYRPANFPNGQTNSEHYHFVASKNGKVIFDPLGQSNAVKFGYVKSKRIFS